eukprot:sb/3474490/
MSINYRIINWRDHLYIDKEAQISDDAISLIFGLLQDSHMRLGRCGANEIKDHPFFQDIDWASLHSLKAPMIPELRFPTDTRYFDSFDEERVRFSDTEDAQDADTPAHPFYEFTFRRFEGEVPVPEHREGGRGPVLV